MRQAGEGRYHGSELSSVQILTPASAGRCYYFFKHYRNYRRDDDAMTKEPREAFGKNRNRGRADDRRPCRPTSVGAGLMELKPVLPAVRCRCHAASAPGA